MFIASFDHGLRHTRWMDCCGTKVLTVRTFVRVVRRERTARLLHTPGLAKSGVYLGRYVDSGIKRADCTPFALFARLMHHRSNGTARDVVGAMEA